MSQTALSKILVIDFCLKAKGFGKRIMARTNLSPSDSIEISNIHKLLLLYPFEPRSEKTCLRGNRPARHKTVFSVIETR